MKIEADERGKDLPIPSDAGALRARYIVRRKTKRI